MKDNMASGSGRLIRRLFIRCGLWAAGVFLFLFVLPRTLQMLFPFVVAFLIAAALNPLIGWVVRQLHAPRRAVALILELLILLLLTGLVGLLVYSAVSEAISFASGLQLNWDDVLQGLDRLGIWFQNILPPQITELLKGVEENLISFLQNVSKNLLGFILDLANTMTTGASGFFVSLVMAVLAAYFITADYHRIGDLLKNRIGSRMGRYLRILKRSVVTALGGYVKSQLLLALAAFIVMFAALTIYGQPYALLIALFLAFIDLLPVVGTIAVLLPWSAVMFIVGNTHKGIFLLILGAGFFLLRKILEPKIVGSQTGLHPLAALMSTFVGLQFFGVWGAVLGPVVLMLIISIVKSGLFDNTFADLKDFAALISLSLRREKSTVPAVQTRGRKEEAI